MQKFHYLLFIFLMVAFTSNAQPIVQAKLGKGINIVAPDSSFALKFSTRFQSLYTGTLNTEDGSYDDAMLIRRARLKFDGFVYSKKLTYKIELGLSNRDIGGPRLRQNNFSDNIVYDAVLKWKFHKAFELWFGQTKLPGNRERVISSQALQFVDRSAVNAYFNLDRDVGMQLRHQFKINKVVFREIVSVSMGEGRNVTGGNVGGYDYTLRGEILPLGEFTNKGDYVSADLEREQTPKLSIGVTYDFNDDASKERGQLGDYLPGTRNLRTLFVDGMFKYKGNSVLFEYADKSAPDGAIILSEDEDGNDLLSAFSTGSGINIQYGYLFENNFEIAARYSHVNPEDEIMGGQLDEYTIGFSKYVVGHTLKVQSDISLIQEDSFDDEVRFRLQVEMGI